jgi:hypothetical protein
LQSFVEVLKDDRDINRGGIIEFSVWRSFPAPARIKQLGEVVVLCVEVKVEFLGQEVFLP